MQDLNLKVPTTAKDSVSADNLGLLKMERYTFSLLNTILKIMKV